jgi:hypothetical protein
MFHTDGWTGMAYLKAALHNRFTNMPKNGANIITLGDTPDNSIQNVTYP